MNDLISFDYLSSSMNYSIIGFILGYSVGKIELKIRTWLKAVRSHHDNT